jgi:deoxyribonuclease-1-like protein
MKKNITLITFFFFLGSIFCYAQISICSWNLKDFGNSKSFEEIKFIANTVKGYDVLAIQEVVAGIGGAQAVAKLWEMLNESGSKWDYIISDPTSSSAYKTERYAFLWKTSKVAIVGNAWLESYYSLEIDREPFMATFKSNNKTFTLLNYHAITKALQPETEIKYLKYLPEKYSSLNLIFCGDFNCPQFHTVFNPLKAMGYNPIFTNQKTSLKQACIQDDCLASQYDNIFYNLGKIKFINSGVDHFYRRFETLKEAELISDHIPIYFEFNFNN